MDTRATKLLLLLLCSILSGEFYAQMDINGNTLYGNEWIDHSQFHYKIPVAEDGVYRLTYQELQTAGIFLDDPSVMGANFQIFHEGEEIPIYVTTTGAFSNGDYVEFYGEKNTGWLDRYLYLSSRRDQLNPEYSMYTDTAIYFLTWNSSTNNNHYVTDINDISNPPVAESYFWHEEKIVYSDKYQQGEDKTGNGLGLAPRYGLGEGYGTGVFDKDQTVNLAFNNPYLSGPQANIELRLGTRSGDHTLRVLFNGDTTIYESFNGWTADNYDFSIATSMLSTNDELRVLETDSDDGYIMASIISTYPRTFDFNNNSTFFFRIPSNNVDRYLEITNFNHGGTAPVIYDITNKRRLVTDLDNGVVKVLLSPFSGERELVLLNETDVKSPASISKKVFTNFDFSASGTDYDYIILSHPTLIDDSNNYIQQYANYRASAAGGSYNALVVDVTDLYDQFSYGIVRQELGIRNFLKLADLHWDTEYLFIMGKGESRQRVRAGVHNPSYDLIPPFGYPNSDYLYVVDNNATTTEPWMAVGRIGAFEPEHVRIYLKKIQEHEAALNGVSQTIEDVSWTKRVLHFAGGDINVEATILADMANFKGMIETSTFGADVISFSKSNSDIETYRSVPNFINEGPAMMTFYGHSTSSSLDFDVGQPEDYNNTGRYPFFYAIGCNTNKLYEGLITLSEDWVLIEDKGAVGFFGSTWLTGLSNLGDYAEIFYRNIGTDMYGSTVGEITVETTKEYAMTSSFTAQQLVQVYTLHGDPAIKLYPSAAPDYLTNEEESQVNPDLIDITTDTITLDLNITNIGKNISGMLDVKFEHKHPNATIVPIQTIQIQAPAYDTSITVRLAITDIENLKGKNDIQVTIDPNNTFAESPLGAESNNVSLIPFYIVESDIKAVYPANFAIVSQQGITLKSSTSNPFASDTKFVIEMDTTNNFDSPLKMSQFITQVGGVVEWSPSITLVNNTTYYWRVSTDASETFGKGFDWDTHSFTFIENSDEGWIQQDFYQFQEDELENMQLNDASKTLEFEPIFSDVRVITGTFPNIPFADIGILLNGFRLYSYYAPCSQGSETIWIAVFDPNTLEVRKKESLPTDFNSCNSIDYLLVKNLKLASERDKTIDFLLNEVRPGDYVVMFTTKSSNNSYNAGDWAADSTNNNGHNIFNILEGQGATQIREMETSETPYIFVYKKDDPSFTPREQKAVAEENIDLITVLEGIKNEGKLITSTVGPAVSWDSFEWSISDTSSVDAVFIDVYGIDQNNQEVLLFDDITASTTSLAGINANTYPYLKLEYFASDATETTPGQIDFLKVLYEGGSDVALASNLEYHFHKEILGKGDQVQLKLAIANLSDHIINDLETSVEITDNDMFSLQSLYTIPQIDPQSNDTLNFILDSEILAIGDYQLVVKTNSNDAILEECYKNNLGIIDFTIEECIADVFVSTTYETGTPVVKVSNTITADNILESEADVIYSATTSITMLPGFHAQSGGSFHALIGGCSLSAIANFPEEEPVNSSNVEIRSNEQEIERETSSPIEVQIAPNPTASIANIRFKLVENGRVKVSIMDLNGKVLTQVFSASASKGWNQTTLDTGNLLDGMYLVVIQNEQTTIVKKLMIDK